MRYTYILIDFFTILFPVLFTFHPRLRFNTRIKFFVPAACAAALFFILWDMYFTKLGVWGFNSHYTLGIYIANLPVEEVLFFFCIPYACMFTYHCINVFLAKTTLASNPALFTNLFIVAALAMSIFFYKKFYTCFTFLLLSLSLFTAAHIIKAGWLARFYVVYAFLLIPFMVVNGLLTGTGLNSPVVWYNSKHIIGFRLLTIPVEDIFYGMDLLLIITIIYMRLMATHEKKSGFTKAFNKMGT